MRSSYLSKIDFGDVISLLTHMTNPKRIVEFGILDGYSLSKFIEGTSITNNTGGDSDSNECQIFAYDIFDDFNGNHSDRDELDKRFGDTPRVTIGKADFYKSVNMFKEGSIDILHVDIANNGEVYEFAINNYLKKIRKGGLMLLEGGSKERDEVEWMNKYDKPKIRPIIEKYEKIYDIFTINKFPSLTVIRP